jgi:hypothetical protein
MAALRIFSYLPNPRIWKATIAARLCGVEVEVRGASPRDLSQWLRDFDARPIADVPPDVLAATERTDRARARRASPDMFILGNWAHRELAASGPNGRAQR